MQPTLYATFDSFGRAQAALAALMRSGVPAEDLSLVFRNGERGRVGAPELLEDLEGIDTAPEGLGVSRPPNESEVSHVFEGIRGGGIGTVSPDDDVSGVEEMDDGQSVAEDMIYPSAGNSFSSQEGHDVGMAAKTGFFQTTRPSEDGIGGRLPTEEDLDAPEDELSPLHVPGFGYVIGSGVLATNAIADQRNLDAQLSREGVPDEEARRYADALRSGRAVLAVATPVGNGNAMAIEAVIEQYQAQDVRTFPEP